MGRVLQSPQVTDLTRPVDLTARVVYFPVRHHSPACAHHVAALIRRARPSAVLVEGPRDATPLIPLLLDPQAKPPIAIYTTYVKRVPGLPAPLRRAAYYPLCDYSPELSALRAAAGVGAKASFIDLTFPEMCVAGREDDDADGKLAAAPKVENLQSEGHLHYSRFLQAACARAGARDPDDLWDSLFELDYRTIDTADFVRNVLAFCTLGRMGHTPEHLAADGTLARERAMAKAIAAEKGTVVVVTGGFHTVALPTTQPAAPPKVDVGKDDALVVLTRYGFEQLDRLNGYSSGMPSPDFYQRRWENADPAAIFVDLGRACRQRGQEISVADEIAALDQCQRLARLRGHAEPSRLDVLDGVRSCFVKGAADAEGLAVLAIARQLLAGDRVGVVPASAGQPPLVRDFFDTADRLNVDAARPRPTETHLDLYRRANHRHVSRFFRRLRFLGVPFAELLKGPDFVAGTDLGRVQEIWKYHWSPEVDSTLIERSLYGPSLEEAALGLLVEQFGQNEQQGQGRRADLAAALVLEACRMGLHRHVAALLDRTGKLVADDPSFSSLVRATDTLLTLQVSREPLEAHDLPGVGELAGRAYDRACYLIPTLAATAEEQEDEAIGSLLALGRCAAGLGDTPDHRELRFARLRDLVDAPTGNAAVRGAAIGLLYGDGQVDAAALAAAFRGHLLGGATPAAGTAFLRGLLRSARSAVWQVPQIIADLDAALTAMDESGFVRQLPLLRLAFADLTPRETDRVAALVAKHSGVETFTVAASSRFTAADAQLAADVQRRLAESLARDGLTAWLDAGDDDTAAAPATEEPA